MERRGRKRFEESKEAPILKSLPLPCFGFGEVSEEALKVLGESSCKPQLRAASQEEASSPPHAGRNARTSLSALALTGL